MHESWQDAANRAKFKEWNLHTLSPDMPAAIENYVEELHTETTVDKFSSQGHYKDKDDLQEKYKNKLSKSSGSEKKRRGASEHESKQEVDSGLMEELIEGTAKLAMKSQRTANFGGRCAIP